ncbi:MAG: hypothetical protein IKG46_09360 [Solobacterium sp.]|nr:hypothetical protein [Solobacterium sp.]
MSDNTYIVRRNCASVIAKDGVSDICGDTYVWTGNYIAVIDGATPKGKKLWNGMKGDICAALLAADAVSSMDTHLTAEQAIAYINMRFRKEYERCGIDLNDLPPAERLQCSVVIYSMERREVWSFGDCMYRIGPEEYCQRKEGDAVFAALRAFLIQIEKDRTGMQDRELSAHGRREIEPYLKEYTALANRDVPFGYDVINGGEICADHVVVHHVEPGTTVILSSDGYPKLLDTFEETEAYLQDALREDSMCIGRLRGTKGISAGIVSFDDRTYVSFTVPDHEQ